MDKRNKYDNIEEIITTGSEIFGSATGGVIGFLLAGTVGAGVGGASGVVVAKTLAKLGKEVKLRLLGKREEARIGATISYAVIKLNERLTHGDELRKDGFFESEINDRSTADEICEGVVLAAQRDHEEKKIKYYGNLIANIGFNEKIDKGQANLLIKLARSLSYRQICLITIFSDTNKYALRQVSYEDKIPSETELSILYEIYELHQLGILNFTWNGMLALGDIIPSEMLTIGMGVALYNLMELYTIPLDELDKLASILR